MRLVNKKHYIIAISQSVSIQRTGKQASFTGRIVSIGGKSVRRLFLLLVLLAFVGAASATDYYVATWGDNSSSGNFTHPWQNVSYATQQAVAGDTIYLFNGTWYNETCDFANSGNSTHQIALTAYNGTPTMRGDGGVTEMIGIKFYSYTTISHLTMANYTHCIQAQTGANHSTIADCDLGYTTGTNNGYVVKIAGKNCHYNTIENCSLHDSGWNTIQLYGNREPPNGNGIPSTHITVRNCTISRNAVHGGIDIFGNLDYIDIDGCTFYSNWQGILFSHDPPDFRDHCVVHDCIFYGNDSHGVIAIDFSNFRNLSIYNNTFYDYNTYAIYMSYFSPNFTANHNKFYNCSAYCIRGNADGCDGMVCYENYMDATSGGCCFTYGADGIVRNPLGWYHYTAVGSGINSSARVEFTGNSVFTATFSGLASQTDVRYYPTNSSCYGISTEYSGSINITKKYNITLRPTYAYLKNVTVNHESTVADDRTNITVNSSVTTNPTWINATMQNASNTYNVSIDGSYATQVVSDSDKVVRYQYTGSWSSHDFEFDWSGGSSPWSPSSFGNYYNATYQIKITVKGYENGSHIFSWSPQQSDNNASSFKIMVKTT